MRYWPPTRSRPPKILRQFNGVNKLDPFSIGESYATDIKNCTSNQYPALTTRKGYSLLGGALAAKILGLGIWKDTELHAISNGNWYKYASGFSSLASGLNASSHWSFANFKGGLTDINLIGANGVDTMRRYDGTAVSTIVGAPSGANYIEQFADRCWSAVGNELKASTYRNVLDWTTVAGDDADSWFTFIETPNGETINAVKGGLRKLTIFKPSSIHELFGYAPSDYRVQPVSMKIGTLNNRCVVTIKGVMFFLDHNALYQYAGGTLPDDSFASPIQDYIDNINASAVDTCCVGTDGQKLYVAIPITSTTNPDTVLEYDPEFGTWYVYEDMKPLHFATLNNTLYQGDADGQVLAHGGTDDNGTTISWEWISKPFGGGSLSQRIRWYKNWIVVDLPSGSSLNVYLSKSYDADDWVLVKTLTSDSDIQSARVIIPTSNVARANWIRVKFSGSGPFTLYEYARDEAQEPLV